MKVGEICKTTTSKMPGIFLLKITNTITVHRSYFALSLQNSSWVRRVVFHLRALTH